MDMPSGCARPSSFSGGLCAYGRIYALRRTAAAVIEGGFAMYRYPASTSTLKMRRRMSILLVLTLVLAIACISLSIAYAKAASANANTSAILVAKAQNEISNAKTRAYQLTQTSSSTVSAMIAQVRQHIYALHQINELTTGIFGGSQVFIDETLLSTCDTYLNECDTKIQGGYVLSDTFVLLRDTIDALYERISSASA